MLQHRRKELILEVRPEAKVSFGIRPRGGGDCGVAGFIVLQLRLRQVANSCTGSNTNTLATQIAILSPGIIDNLVAND